MASSCAGNTALMAQVGVRSTRCRRQAEELRAEGASVMMLALTAMQQVCCRLRSIKSAPRRRWRPEAAVFASSWRPAMDSRPPNTVAAKLGIDGHGEVKPADKLAMVEKAQAKVGSSRWQVMASRCPGPGSRGCGHCNGHWPRMWHGQCAGHAVKGD